MTTLHRFLLPIILIIQIAVCLFTFKVHITNPANSLLFNDHDGFKNYVTLNGYVSQNADESPLIYKGMNYPYGDVITYTDNTPLIAHSLKLLSNVGIIRPEAAINIFNLIIIFGIVLASFFIFLILRRFIESQWLIAIASLCLPWISPQILRLSNGHFNLSQSWLLLFILYLLILFISIKSKRSKLWISIGLVATLILSAGYHVYYLPIGGVLIAGILAINFLVQKCDWRDLYAWLPAVLIPFMAYLIFTGILVFIDPYYGERLSVHDGFALPDWSLKFNALFTKYPHFGIDFPIHGATRPHYESNAYLGGFFLFGLTFLMVTGWRRSIALLKEMHAIKVLLLGGCFLVIIALGTRIHIPALDWHVENFISPFYWGKKISDAVYHIRCFGRFNWPAFWIFNIVVIALLDRTISTSNRSQYFIYGLLIFLVLDAKDSINFYKSQHYANPFYTSMVVPDELEAEKFKAIAPFPFFHIGSGIASHSINADPEFFKTCAILSNQLNLPLVGSLMSRTPYSQTDQLFNIFIDPENSALRDMKLSTPLLIAVDRNLLIAQSELASGENNSVAADLFQKQIEILSDSTQVKLVGQSGKLQLLEWKPRGF